MRCIRRVCESLLVCSLAAIVAGCLNNSQTLKQPRTLYAPPYAQVGLLWAVAPLTNESGTTLFDPLQVSDQLVAQLERVEGMRTLPMNRTLAAMSSLKMARVSSPQDARRLIEATGADALLVGSISTYDPYNPPKFGMRLALFARPNALERDQHGPTPEELKAATLIDPVTLRTAPVEISLPKAEWLDRPLSVAAAQLDGVDQGVQISIKDYAEGRSETISALGWRRYLASMRLFTDFACYHITERLLDAESRRIGAPPPVKAEPEPTRIAGAAAKN